MTESSRYAAFISYSSTDARFAHRLHGALEGYGIPASLGKFDLVGGGKRNRIYPVFRDREELPTGDLSELIEASLKASAALIVVCSPTAAQSPWVEKEIAYFAGLGRRPRIFAIIADTAPLRDETGADATEASFPRAFRGDALAGEAIEPLAADARPGKDGFRNAWLKVAAGLIGVSPGQLIDRDERRRRQRRIALGAAAAAAALALAIGVTWLETPSWRARLSSYAQAIADQELRPVDALPFALAGAPVPGAIVQARAPGADAVLRRIGVLRIHADLDTHDYATMLQDGRLASFRSDDALIVRDIDRGSDRPFALSDPALAQATDRHAVIVEKSGSVRIYALSEPLKQTEFHVAAPVSSGLLSQNGAVLMVRDERDHVRLHSIPNGELIADIGEVGALADLTLSPGGAWLYARSASKGAAGYNLTTGGVRVPVDDVGQTVRAYGLWDDGRILLTQDSGTEAILYDLTHRTPPQVLGPFSSNVDVSQDGAIAVGLREDLHALVYDFAGDTRARDLGHVGSALRFDLSGDGSRFAVRRAGQRAGAAGQGAIVYDIRDGRAPLKIGGVGDPMRFELSHDGAWLMTANREHHSALYDLENSGARVSLGLSEGFFSGSHFFTATDTQSGRAVVYDLGRRVWAPDRAPGGEALAHAVCAASGRALSPFPARLRNPSVAARTQMSPQERAVYEALRGRPWNPCDWRGFASINADAARGDSWFEGVRQWLRLMRVRYLGGKDWTCEETTSRASPATRTARTDMCARVASTE